jgi:raffinose/stachyose/melibiose transport system permease protein
MGLPALALFLAFYLYPALQNLQFATRRWDGITEPEFVGFRNFTNLLTNDDLFYKTLGNNLEFTFLVVIFQTMFALLFAIYLVNNTKANIALRTLYFFPTILSSVSVGMIWLFLYDPNFGAINLFFNKIGLNFFALNWLGDENSALYAIAFTQVWFHTGQMMVVYIAGLQQIPKELYESARLDGCNDFRLFTKIALPLSWPLISLLAFFAFIGNWANYFLPYILLPSSENFTLPIGLGFLFYSTPAINPGVGATSVPIYKPEIALAGVLIALPIMIVFLVSQKRLVRGMLAGSIKE